MPITRAPRPPVSNQLININNLIALSEKIEEEKYEKDQLDVQIEVEPEIDEDDFWLVKYDELAQKSMCIPLSHLGCCKEGGDLFSSLCMWVDVNQRYVDLGLFPQWYDIARELNIDQMKTDWVKVCVRPEQSFTRAILEIYMNDGGTLGEVITALRKQKQYRIIQEISEKAEEFIDVYTVYHKNNFNPAVTSENHVYSIMRTLFETFNKAGYEDPLGKYQDYSQGFKQYINNKHFQDGTPIVVNTVNIEDSTQLTFQDSGYTSPYEYGGYLPSMPCYDVSDSISALRKKSPNVLKETKLKEAQPQSEHPTIRILLVFSRDGVDSAENIVNIVQQYTYPEDQLIKVDVFRLNEIDVWNALVQNPEACIIKWLDEMDFIMPILTPQFLMDLHTSGEGNGPPAPTSPLINKYIYALLRAEYLANQCRNLKVRPFLPREFEPAIGRSKPLTKEPMFKMWNYTEREIVVKRLNGIVKQWKKNQ